MTERENGEEAPPEVETAVEKLVEVLPPELRDENAKKIAARLLVSYEEKFVSPFPPPRLMREYEEVHPGLTARHVREIIAVKWSAAG